MVLAHETDLFRNLSLGAVLLILPAYCVGPKAGLPH